MSGVGNMETAIDSGRVKRKWEKQKTEARSESNSETPNFQMFFGGWVIL